MTTLSSNPISVRVKKLELLWAQFSAKPNARIARWLVSEDEVRMITGFVELMSHEDNTHKDIFFEFELPFVSLSEYSPILVNYLAAILDADEEVLRAEDLAMNWKPTELEANTKNKALHFISNFTTFTEQLTLLPNSLVVAFLTPPAFDAQFDKWLKQAIEAGIPNNIRFMLIDLKGQNWFDKLAKEHPDTIVTLQPDLDMSSAMQQLAAQAAAQSGSTNEPSHRYTQAFLELSEAVGKQDLRNIELKRHLPQQIAREQNWAHLEVAVLALTAGSYFGLQKFKEALPYYDEAIYCARRSVEMGEATGVPLTVQMLMSKAVVYVASKDFKMAVPLYSEAAKLAEISSDYILTMEAYRMEGYCLGQIGKKAKALIANMNALEASEQLNEHTRINSTLPYTAAAIIKLTYDLGKKDEYNHYNHKFNTLFGAGWEKKLEQK